MGTQQLEDKFMKTYDETKYPYKAKLAIEYMIDSLNEAQAEVTKYKDLAEQNWKIQPFKPYLRDTFEFTWSKPDGRYGFKGDDMELKTTREEIAAMKTQDAATHEENKVIAAQNSACFKKLADLMTTMGIKQTVTDSKSRKMFKPQIRADFIREIEAQCKTYQPSMPDWDSIERTIKERAEKKRLADLEIQKKKDEEQSKKKENKVIIGLVKKYDIPVENGIPNAREILDVILEKDKYLRLAHYLLKNREDWNDGYSYAESGLSGFNIETEADQLIYDEISSCIGENWDGDGRVFRSGKYSYDNIFGMANEDIYKDYVSVKEFIKEY
jgi:hypothetical protein